MSQRIMTVNHRYLLSSVLLVVLCTGAEASAQAPPRGEPVADEWSRVFKLPGKGSLDLGNLSGEIVVVGGAGDEIRVSAVRQEGKGRRGRPEADDVRIVVNEGAGRVEIRTEHPRRGGHGDVDFTVHVPVYTDLNIRSVSGEVRIEKVQGEVRAESVSGSVTVTDVGKLQLAKSVSGEVTVSGAGGNVVNSETVSGGAGPDSQQLQLPECQRRGQPDRHEVRPRARQDDQRRDRVRRQLHRRRALRVQQPLRRRAAHRGQRRRVRAGRQDVQRRPADRRADGRPERRGGTILHAEPADPRHGR